MDHRLVVATSDRVFSRNVGGNSTYARTLYEHLPAHGVSHRLLAPRVSPANRRVRGLTYAAWEATLPSHAADDVDVLHYTNDTGPVVARGGPPVVVSIHGVASAHIEGARGPVQERLWRARVQRAARTATAVITPSRSSAHDVTTVFGVPSDRIHVIGHGVDHARFHPGAATTPAGREALAELDLPDRFVLFLGNLDPRKNVRVLIDAFTSEPLSRLGIPLVVAGAPAWRDTRIVDDLQAAGIRYLGQVPAAAVAPLLARATLFAFPSLYEGFGLPVLEAMACGTAVVTSDRGSLPEVTGNGWAAAVTEPTRAAVTAQITDLLTDDAARRDLEQRGPQRAGSFTWDAAAATTAEVFHTSAARRSVAA